MQSQDLPLTSWRCLRGSWTSQASHPFSLTRLGFGHDRYGAERAEENVEAWCFQLTRDKPERKYGWIGNEIEIWGLHLTGGFKEMWFWSAEAPRWGLRHKWLNTKMTYGINGVQDAPLHPLLHFSSRLASSGVDETTFKRHLMQKRLNQSWAAELLKPGSAFFPPLTCCEDTDDSHNVSACPSGHLALDCPNHKTNCIIRPAPLGTGTF